MGENFNKIETMAENLGVLLDGCGSYVRYYSFGSFIDLCDLDYSEPEIPKDMFKN